jgi:hypothetical protein
MTVELLRDCVVEFNEGGDATYFEYLPKIQQLKDDSGEELPDQLIEFLNKWRCRLPASLREPLKEALRDIQALITPTRQFTIEEADLSAVVPVGGHQNLQLAQIAHICLDRLSAVGKHFSSVASAKALHMLSPTFFVMWDRTICERYRSVLSASGCDGWFYAYEFLPCVQREVKNLIEDGTKEGGRSREQVLAEVRSGFGSFSTTKTVAKVVDEFNYIMFTIRKVHEVP